jgi:hypothetical protein
MLQQEADRRPSSIKDVKNEINSAQRQFVALQKVSQISGTVIPDEEVDDPLIADPLQLIDWKWNQGLLTLVLSQPVNPTWLWALHNMLGFSSAFGKGPEMFKIHGDQAAIQANPDEVQRLIDHFKSWIPLANQRYEHKVREDQRQEQENRKEQLRKKKEMADAEARLLREVKI